MFDLLTRVTVSNYQGIGEADLEIGGLTVIVGPGDHGKSALLRAIAACLFNQTGTEFIRHGQDACAVSLYFGEADTFVEWNRDKKAAWYKVGGENRPMMTYTKLAGGVPEEIQAIFGIRALEIDKGFSITPQYHDQFAQPLLLMESSGRAARALAKLTKLEGIVRAQVAAAKDKRAANTEVSRLSTNITQQEAELQHLPNLKKARKDLKRANVALDKATNEFQDIRTGRNVLESYKTATAFLERFEAVDIDFDTLRQQLDELERGAKAYGAYQSAAGALTTSTHELADIDQALAHAQDELNELLATVEVCPVCERPMEGHDDQVHRTKRHSRR